MTNALLSFCLICLLFSCKDREQEIKARKWQLKVEIDSIQSIIDREDILMRDVDSPPWNEAKVRAQLELTGQILDRERELDSLNTVQ